MINELDEISYDSEWTSDEEIRPQYEKTVVRYSYAHLIYLAVRGIPDFFNHPPPYFCPCSRNEKNIKILKSVLNESVHRMASRWCDVLLDHDQVEECDQCQFCDLQSLYDHCQRKQGMIPHHGNIDSNWHRRHSSFNARLWMHIVTGLYIDSITK